MQLKYFKELDGVRGVAALMVIFFHIRQAGIGHDLLARILNKAGNFGQTGVTLFFVLSGFLITRILLVSKHKESYFQKFYIRRSLRIFPLYYLALAIYVLIIPMFLRGHIDPFSKTWPFWVYLQNIGQTFKWSMQGPGHFWSLAVEEHFYLVWPFVIYYLSDKWILRTIILIIPATILIRVLMLNNGYDGIFYFTPTNMDCLTMGGFLALNEKYQWLNTKKTFIIMVLTLGVLGVNWYIFKGEGNKYVQIFKLPLIAFFYTAIINLVISTKSYFNQILKLRLFTYTGTVSYGLYIFHPLCIRFLETYIKDKPFIVALLLIMASSYLVASLSYYGFEKFFLKQKDRFETFKFLSFGRNRIKTNIN